MVLEIGNIQVARDRILDDARRSVDANAGIGCQSAVTRKPGCAASRDREYIQVLRLGSRNAEKRDCSCNESGQRALPPPVAST